MILSELNLSSYLNGFIHLSINNKIYLSKGDIVGFEIKSIPPNELYIWTEIDDNNNQTDNCFYVVFKQSDNSVTLIFSDTEYNVVGTNQDSIILSNHDLEYFISPISI